MHVVIIGFSHVAAGPPSDRHVIEYDRRGLETRRTTVKNISPYLTDGPNLAVAAARKPLSAALPVVVESEPCEGILMSALSSGGFDDHPDLPRHRAQQLLDGDGVTDFVRTRGKAQLEAIEGVHGVAASHPDMSPWTPASPTARVPESSSRTPS